MTEQDKFELENRKKYGEKGNDEISNQFKINALCGIGFCFGNINKYLKRYVSESEKAKNELDVKKEIDYLIRVYELNFIEKSWCDIFIGYIESKQIEKAINFSNRMQVFIINNLQIQNK